MKFFRNHPDLSLFGIVILMVIFMFRNVFFFGQVPFPGNLLVSFYQPWRSYAQPQVAKPLGFDTLRVFYPTRTLVTQSLKAGHLPLWNPYSFSGNVLLGAYQSAVFFPLGFLFLLTTQIKAWSIIIILIPLFAYIFTYFFLRELGLSPTASFFGAITWAFSGMMVVWWEEMFMATYSIVTLPLVFYAIEKLSKKLRALHFLLLVAGLAISLFSGWFQATFYLVVFSVIWLIFRWFHQKKKQVKNLVVILLGCLTALLMSGVQLIPGLEAYLLSSRGGSDTKEMFSQFFAKLPHLITFLAPDYFGNPATHNYFGTSFYHEQVIWIGIPALIFLLYEMLHIFRAPAVSRFFSIGGLVTLSLGFGLPTSWFLLYTLHLPFVSEMTPSRIFFLSGFCFSVSAALGLDRFLKKASWRVMTVIFLGIAATFVGAWWFAWKYQIAMAYLRDIHAWVPIRNLIVPSIFFFASIVGIMLLNVKQKVGYVLILAIAFGSSVYFAQKYLYFSDRAFTYPQVPVVRELQQISGIGRFWSVGEGTMVRNFANELGLYSPEGYESFNSKRYGELIFSSHRQGQFPTELQRADALLYLAKNMQELSENPYTLRLLRLLGVKYIAALSDKSPEHFTKVWTDGKYDIFRYDKALPRYFLTNQFVVERDPQKILDIIYASDAIVLEEEPLSVSSEVTGTATLVRYEPEKIIFKTSSSGNELLFLSDTYYPGWIATVDNKIVPIYRANYAFRAVPVSKGEHTVIMEYQPKSVKIGAIFTTLGIILFFASIFWLRKPFIFK